MNNQTRSSHKLSPAAQDLESKLIELEELLMDLRAELRFLGCKESHPLTERLISLINDLKTRQSQSHN